ncbi:MAG: hypothetical protein JXB26_16300 [Candidatus Aminicenantes bacterium]|nr:hypothetical protein [Candidatus Aminicenantes bacterium]
MKKLIFFLLLSVFMILATAPKSSADNPVNFYLRGGVITESSFSFNPLIGLAGANIDINLGEVLMISPECDLLIYQFKFNPVFITPGVLLNVRASVAYFGAGLSLPIIIGSGYTLEGDFLLKFNAGFKADFIKIQAFMFTPMENAFSYNWFGATVGFGF